MAYLAEIRAEESGDDSYQNTTELQKSYGEFSFIQSIRRYMHTHTYTHKIVDKKHKQARTETTVKFSMMAGMVTLENASPEL